MVNTFFSSIDSSLTEYQLDGERGSKLAARAKSSKNWRLSPMLSTFTERGINKQDD